MADGNSGVFSKARLFPPHLVATSLHTLTRVTFAMAGRLVRLLVVEFFGVCVLFWGFFVLFFFFLVSFPLFLAFMCVVCMLPH